MKTAAIKRFGSWLIERTTRRKPDVVIVVKEHPYLNRWYLLPRNRFLNAYLHQFLTDDDDRELHDHPWSNCSIILQNEYTEHTIQAGGIHRREILTAGQIRIRLSGKAAHRIELHNGPCWTLFVTGPSYRTWGFHCPEQGWIPWRRFVSRKNRNETGAGCNG